MSAGVKAALRRAGGQRGSKKRNNPLGVEAKIGVRRAVAAEVLRRGSLRVLETHAGRGFIRAAAYQDAEDWLGFDVDQRCVRAVTCDSRVGLRAVDLSRFTLFDVDPFGSPWEQVWLISRRRRLVAGEAIGLCITVGNGGQVARWKTRAVGGPVGLSLQMVDVLGTGSESASFAYTMEHTEAVSSRLIGAWFAPARVTRWVAVHAPGGSGLIHVGCVVVGAT